jgi:hypothetical protein
MELNYQLKSIMKTEFKSNEVGKTYSWLPGTGLLGTKAMVVPLAGSELRYSLTL